MKKLLLLLALSACLDFSYAQYSKADLLKVLTDHPQQDTARVNHLITLFTLTGFPAADRVKFAEEALAISRKVGYTRGEGYSLLYLASFKALDGQGDSAFNAAVAFAEKSRDPDLLGYSNLRQGIMIFYTNRDRKAFDFFFKAEKLFEQTGNYYMLSITQSSIAGIYFDHLSLYPAALEYYLKAKSSAEKVNGVSNAVEIYFSLGILYSGVGDYDKALSELQAAEEIMRKSGSGGERKNILYNTYGETYRLAGKYKEAIESYKLAIQNTPVGLTEVDESNLADVYSRIDSVPLALHYAFKSLGAMRENERSAILLGWVYASLSRAYLKKNMVDSALYYGHIGLDTSMQVDNLEFIRNNTEELAKAYAYKKDFANAYKYYVQFVTYRDSMLGAQVRNKTTLMQQNVEMDKKQAQITQLHEQQKAQRTFLISALIVLAVIVTAAALLLRSNRHKQKANQLLQKQKQDIELLGDIGRKISSSLSVETIISTVYDNVNSLMDASVFGIGIYHDQTKTIDFPATYENGQALPAYSNSVFDDNRLAGLCFISGKEMVISDLNSEYSKYLQHLPNPVAGDQAASLIYLPLKVKEKMFGVLTVQSFKKHAYSDYQLKMLRNIAIYAAVALENAESFKQLNTTVTTLQNTQKQLIQSEKMASLGELTAGIAHEIQNPLNFVNNFSDINRELIGELVAEIENKNYDEVTSLANDIKVNEDKINFHGKRADGIVKGMLQHSRSSTGHKEPTDINVLCDEYLRLAYHGLRAKDKTFNATLKSELDEKAGTISVVPQDMGRVILNLLTNAFYAVKERSKKNIADYQPTVLVSTKRFADRMEVKVSDNGGGIPPNIVNKIFQPFFTTKPTGQGTGLGLSMSYDIVTKAHNGDLKVSSSDEGTEFTIILPLK